MPQGVAAATGGRWRRGRVIKETTGPEVFCRRAKAHGGQGGNGGERMIDLLTLQTFLTGESFLGPSSSVQKHAGKEGRKDCLGDPVAKQELNRTSRAKSPLREHQTSWRSTSKWSCH